MKINKKPRKRENVNIPKNIEDSEPILEEFINGINPEGRNLDYFYHNAETLVLKEVSEKGMSDERSYAEYNIRYNFINYLKNKMRYGIMHELFHMASTVRTRKRIYSGFLQIDLETSERIGIGLMEAYTAILDERYFPDIAPGKKELFKDVYAITKNLTKILEDFVGTELMEKYYLEADLYSLVDTLSLYMPKEYCLEFVCSMDKLFYYCDNAIIPKVKETLRSYEYCLDFLGNCFLRVWYEKLYLEEINDDEFEELVEETKKLLMRPLKFKYLSFLHSRPLTDNKFNEYVEEARKYTLKKYT